MLIELGIATVGIAPLPSGGILFIAGILNYGAFPIWQRLVDIRYIRSAGERHGDALAKWLEQQITAGKIAIDAPIHFIGHSAGGFAVAKCAGNLLAPRTPPRVFSNLLVTTLDTPMLTKPHILGVKDHGGRIERYNIELGKIASPDVFLMRDRWAVYPVLFSTTDESTPAAFLSSVPTIIPDAGYRIGSAQSTGRCTTGHFKRHSEAHEWYIDSVASADTWRDGFYFSPFLGNTWSGTVAVASASSLRVQAAASAALPDQPLAGFQSFGQVSQTAAQFTLTEADDAGIFKTLTVPIGATDLKFRVRFDQIGEGDFLTVTFGDHAPLAVIDGASMLPGQWLDYEASTRALAGENGTLMFRLVSRGASNAVAIVDSIALGMSDDPDGDGLTNAEEASLGTNPLLFDTDGDGFGDGDEVNLFHTAPLRADSDGVGMDDYLKIAAGLDPMDSRSVFAVTGFSRVNGGFMLRWSSVRGKTYRVVRSSAADFASFDVLASGLVATGPASAYLDTATDPAATPRMFYRIELEQAAQFVSGDSDGDGIADAQEAMLGTDPGRYDSDKDGIGDGEEVNFLHTNPLRADTDGDGASDFVELLAGTDPTNASSVLKMTSISRNADGSVTLKWAGVSGRTYSVLRSITPDFSSYETLRTGWPGLPPITTFSDTSAGAVNGPALFYKVSVE